MSRRGRHAAEQQWKAAKTAVKEEVEAAAVSDEEPGTPQKLQAPVVGIIPRLERIEFHLGLPEDNKYSKEALYCRINMLEAECGLEPPHRVSFCQRLDGVARGAPSSSR